MCGRIVKARTPTGWRTVEGYLALGKKNAGKARNRQDKELERVSPEGREKYKEWDQEV